MDFHDAVNFLRVLEEDERRVVSRKVLEIGGFTDYYLEVCMKAPLEIQTQNVNEIIDAYIEDGADTSKNLLNTLCEVHDKKSSQARIAIDMGIKLEAEE